MDALGPVHATGTSLSGRSSPSTPRGFSIVAVLGAVPQKPFDRGNAGGWAVLGPTVLLTVDEDGLGTALMQWLCWSSTVGVEGSARSPRTSRALKTSGWAAAIPRLRDGWLPWKVGCRTEPRPRPRVADSVTMSEGTAGPVLPQLGGDAPPAPRGRSGSSMRRGRSCTESARARRRCRAWAACRAARPRVASRAAVLGECPPMRPGAHVAKKRTQEDMAARGSQDA